MILCWNAASLNPWRLSRCGQCVITRNPSKPCTTKAIRLCRRVIKNILIFDVLLLTLEKLQHLEPLSQHCCLAQPRCNALLLQCCKLESVGSYPAARNVSSPDIPPKPRISKKIRLCRTVIKRNLRELQSFMFYYLVPRNGFILDHSAPHWCFGQQRCNLVLQCVDITRSSDDLRSFIDHSTRPAPLMENHTTTKLMALRCNQN